VRTALIAVLVAAMPAVAAAQGAYSAPRTPDGQPDLQGVWTNDTLTPLERPANLGDRKFLTEAEAAALESRALERRCRFSEPRDPVLTTFSKLFPPLD
jgi:hypothetical protein